MNSTPSANRKHITLFGKTNSGKSSLLNAIVGQEVSLVSQVKGTTTDPVTKAMELIPFGPVVFIDTAGLDDRSELGGLRIQRSFKMLQRTDFAMYVMDINDMDEDAYYEMARRFKKYNIPHMLVINKIDTVPQEKRDEAAEKFKDAVLVSAKDWHSVLALKDELIKRLQEGEEEPPIVGDLIPYNGKVILVVPIDSEAPKGRIILPQVQVIRDCLDHGIKSYVVRDTELESALSDIRDVDLVITDSQAFARVSAIVPGNIKLTSFSILFARYKGDLDTFVKGVSKVEELNENSRILITESCTHNTSHEDIGRIKIPRLLNKHVGMELNYDFKMGHDFPENIEEYDLVIHCGSCMMNKKTMQTRIDMCMEKGVSITNYGVLLAYLTGILDRCLEIFRQ
ncbi:MAG TPA: [FeFe] hydrogenase H-cluster maturation GTPase HydF [Clostridiaceae bacterium]|nr:[FeFe] hydrogenase H-cluster maturation GTPase HydF [Clostridiaceae bacterium]